MSPYYDTITPEAISGTQLDHALSLGWYRSTQKIFTCSHVDLGGIFQVHWLRYNVDQIKDRRSFRKIRRKNKSFQFTIEDFTNDIRDDHVQLYKAYRAKIDFDGADSIQDSLFGDFTDPNIFNTKQISVYDNDKLIAGGYFDAGNSAVASILHFYDPEYSYFSPGRYLILLTIDYMRIHGYKLYYPGYVVQGLPKMNYKLLLGKEHAEYFDPSVLNWKPFHDELLVGKAIDLEQFKSQIAEIHKTENQ